jgi:hypothetical protein
MTDDAQRGTMMSAVRLSTALITSRHRNPQECTCRANSHHVLFSGTWTIKSNLRGVSTTQNLPDLAKKERLGLDPPKHPAFSFPGPLACSSLKRFQVSHHDIRGKSVDPEGIERDNKAALSKIRSMAFDLWVAEHWENQILKDTPSNAESADPGNPD